MITLQKQFVSGKGGFAAEPLTYTQIARNTEYAVYERSRDGHIKDYEVFRIKVDKAGTVLKFPNNVTKTIDEDTENYAVTSQWGRTAYSFHGVGGKDAALAKMESLTNGVTHVITPTNVTVKGSKCGRVAKVHPAIVMPNKERFTMKDLLENQPTTWSQPNMYAELKKLIVLNKVKAVDTQRSPSGRGKPMIVYSAC